MNKTKTLVFDGKEVSPELIEAVRLHLKRGERLTRFGELKGGNVRFTPRLQEILTACDTVRYCRSSWLYAIVQKRCGSMNESNFLGLLKRIRKAGLIRKIDTRKRIPNAINQPDVYEITPQGRRELENKKCPLSPVTFSGGGSFLHNLGTCDCVLSAYLTGELKPVPQQSFKLQKGTIKPDAIFGYKGHYYALEYDRATEDYSSQFNPKVEKYREVIRYKLYEKLGLPNIWPVFIFTEYARLKHTKKHIEKLSEGKGNHSILLKLRPGEIFLAPEATDWLVSTPFERSVYPEWKIETPL